MSWTTRLPALVGALVLVGLITSPAWATLWFLRERSDTWRYAFYSSPIESIPPEVFTGEYPDSDWAIGSAPFGIVDSHCVWSVGTPWAPTLSTVVARTSIDIPMGTTRLVYGFRHGDGTYRCFVNGVSTMGVDASGGCIGGSEQNPVSPWPPGGSAVWRWGKNTLVLAAENYGGSRLLDAFAYGDVSPVRIQPDTWGRLKSLYR
jgi:hypothetical protein